MKVKNIYQCNGHDVLLTVERKGKPQEPAIIDEEFADAVMAEQWRVQTESKTGNLYLATSGDKIGNSKPTIYLQKFIAHPPEGWQVDHINHDTLNNRWENLLPVPYGRNSENPMDLGMSGIKWDAQKQMYLVTATRYRHTTRIGYYSTLEEAKDARSLARTIMLPYSYERSICMTPIRLVLRGMNIASRYRFEQALAPQVEWTDLNGCAKTLSVDDVIDMYVPIRHGKATWELDYGNVEIKADHDWADIRGNVTLTTPDAQAPFLLKARTEYYKPLLKWHVTAFALTLQR